ncbi:MAG: multicopper oxidase family protein [Candidatus Nanopelagicales bacterium]|nr:multicopper oxidase family protein [Candidatus Nanopelagicales bacterium]
MTLPDLTRRDALRLGALAAGAGLLAGALPATPAAAASRWRTPSVLRATDGVLALTLTAQQGLIPFNGTRRWAMTYNGTDLPPQLRLRPGDLLRVRLVNRLPQMTNLHTHGLHVSPTGASDNPYVMVESGSSFDYEIRIPRNQPVGTFWYHPHVHGSSAPQVNLGMAGSIVIEDPTRPSPVPAGATDRTIVLSDPVLGTTSAVARTTMMDQMHGRSGTFVLLNGQLDPTIPMTGGRLEFWRLINTSVTRNYQLTVDSADLHLVGTDGGPLGTALPRSTITLTPGERAEIVVRPRTAGALAVRDFGTRIATLASPGALPAAALRTLAPVPALATVDRRRTLTMVETGGMMGGTPTFDGRPFDAARIDQRVSLGTVEEWTIANTTHMAHPFHLHVWPYQVVARSDGSALPGWRDTVLVPANGWVRIRIAFADIRGKTVYHCHILDHEDAGMMGNIVAT